MHIRVEFSEVSVSSDSLFSFFYTVSERFNERGNEYSRRFVLSSCEQWLSTEMCMLINEKYHLSDHGRFFCYNEDDRRDLTFYLCDEIGRPEILGHAEIKLIYPVSVPKRKKNIEHLVSRVVRYHTLRYSTEGWCFFIWTSGYEKDCTADTFFSLMSEELSMSVNDKARRLYLPTPTFGSLVSLCDTHIKWRGESVRIIARAIPFTFFSGV